MRSATLVPVLTLLAFTAGSAFADHPETVIVINPDGTAHTGDKTIYLRDEVGGNGSDHAFVTIVNKSGVEVRYEIHTHHKLDFLKFHERGPDDGHGLLPLPIKDTLKSGAKNHRYPVYVHLKEGEPGIFQDVAHVTVWDADGKKLADREFQIVATFFAKGEFTKGRPDGYQMWTMDDGRFRRWNEKDLPIRVFSDDPAQQAIVERAVRVWNVVGTRAGLKKPFFELVSKKSDCHCEVAWKDKLDERGHAHLRDGEDCSYIERDHPAIEIWRKAGGGQARIAETLLQEFGHLLGLGHSDDPSDILKTGLGDKGRYPELRFVRLSERDIAAVQWLYSQPLDKKSCVPIQAR